jgi:hypothetical protein
MKRCPQCSRVETDDALVYCRVDGAALNSDSASAFNETETRILPHTTDASIDRSTAPTTALPVTVPRERRPVNLPSYNVALFFAELGDKDKAFSELDRAYNNRESYLRLIKTDPRFDSLRDDARFKELMKKVGFPE